jgi:hypothetical protein
MPLRNNQSLNTNRRKELNMHMSICVCLGFFFILFFRFWAALSWWWSYISWIYNYLCNQCLSPLMLWVWVPFIAGVRDTILCDQVCQWLATGRWFSPWTPGFFILIFEIVDCTFIFKMTLNNLLNHYKNNKIDNLALTTRRCSFRVRHPWALYSNKNHFREILELLTLDCVKLFYS